MPSVLPPRYNLAGFTVLVVDDHPLMARLLAGLLTGFGAGRVLLARDTDAASVWLRRAAVDVMITELDVAPLDGCTLTRRVRQGQAGCPADLPIVMISERTERRHVLAARDAGISTFVAKPMSPAALFDRLVAAIERPPLGPHPQDEGWAAGEARRPALVCPTEVAALPLPSEMRA